MCLAIPGRVVEIEGSTGKVEFNGVAREANLTLLPDVEIGDYVLVHAGFGIQRLDASEAKETLRLFEQVAEAAEAEIRERSDD